MNNDSETVREVCEEMKDQNKSGIAQSYWNDTTVHIVDAWHCVEAYSDRILSAHEREMAAVVAERDAEIRRRVLLERALKPVIECNSDFDSCAWMADQLDEEQMDAVDGLHTAVREAQRIMKEGGAE